MDPEEPTRSPTPWLLRRPFRTVAVATILFAAIGFRLSLIDGPFDPNKVGTLGEWTAGLGAVALIAFALHEVAEARTAAQAAEDRRTADEVDRANARRRSQAELVAAWYAGLSEGDLPDRVIVHLANRSALPVYETYIEVFRREGRDEGWLTAHQPQGVLGPTAEPMRIITSSGVVEGDRRPGVAIRFRDAAGVYWRRTTQGQLEEMTGPPPYAVDEPSIEEQLAELRRAAPPPDN